MAGYFLASETFARKTVDCPYNLECRLGHCSSKVSHGATGTAIVTNRACHRRDERCPLSHRRPRSPTPDRRGRLSSPGISSSLPDISRIACAQRLVERQQKDMEPHLAIIFGQGYRGINRSFPRRDRHARGVTYDDGSFHQRAARSRIDDFREFLQGFDDFAGSFAACRDDHDVDIRVAARHLLKNGFPRAERTGDTVGSTLGHRKEGVDDPVPGDHRLLRLQALDVAIHGPFYRPGKCHGYVFLDPVPVLDDRDRIIDRIIAFIPMLVSSIPRKG